MEESRALSKLTEATDLLILLEDILNPASIERLSQASWSGLRLTLKSARAILQESQSSLSKEFVARARSSQSLNSASLANVSTEGRATSGIAPSINPVQQLETESNLSIPQNSVQITRRDLKASLEKFIESR